MTRGLVFAEEVSGKQHLVHERCLTVVNVGNDGDVTNVCHIFFYLIFTALRDYSRLPFLFGVQKYELLLERNNNQSHKSLKEQQASLRERAAKNKKSGQRNRCANLLFRDIAEKSQEAECPNLSGDIFNCLEHHFLTIDDVHTALLEGFLGDATALEVEDLRCEVGGGSGIADTRCLV